MGQSTFTAAEQQRLLEISRDVGAIGELCKDAREPFCMPDGSPMLTTQAATVLAVYRHIAKTVSALEPGRVKEVIDSLALAAGNLEPTTALELLLQEEHADDGIPIVAALKQSFDDQQVALLLARALSSPGHATSRLARVLDTLAPDDQRKKRVLTLAKKLISERDFGSKRPIDDIRKSLDELLLQYDESTYVSKDYRESMDVAASRAADLAARGLPAEMDAVARHARFGQRPQAVGPAADRPAAQRDRAPAAWLRPPATWVRSSKSCCSPAPTASACR